MAKIKFVGWYEYQSILRGNCTYNVEFKLIPVLSFIAIKSFFFVKYIWTKTEVFGRFDFNQTRNEYICWQSSFKISFDKCFGRKFHFPISSDYVLDIKVHSYINLNSMHLRTENGKDCTWIKNWCEISWLIDA